jgi:hypothetical protein
MAGPENNNPNCDACRADVVHYRQRELRFNPRVLHVLQDLF